MAKGAWSARETGLGASVGAVVGEGCLWPKVRGALLTRLIVQTRGWPRQITAIPGARHSLSGPAAVARVKHAALTAVCVCVRVRTCMFSCILARAPVISWMTESYGLHVCPQFTPLSVVSFTLVSVCLIVCPCPPVCIKLDARFTPGLRDQCFPKMALYLFFTFRHSDILLPRHRLFCYNIVNIRMR